MGPTEAEVSRGAVKSGTLRGPAQGNHSATLVLLQKTNPETNISREQCVARLFGSQPRRGRLREAEYEAKQLVDGLRA